MEGQSVVKDLVLELQTVRNAPDLEKIKGGIEEKMEILVDIMIEVSEQEKHLISSTRSSTNNLFASDILRYELVRIMKIDGCKEILEKVQREPLYRLAKHADKKRSSYS